MSQYTVTLFRYREQQEKIVRLRDETVRSIIKNSGEIVMLKQDVTKQLQYIQDIADADQ